MKKSLTIQFADKNLMKSFEKLENSKGDKKKLHKFLVRAFKDIETDINCGIPIPKKLIPKDYIKKYKIDNLWKYNLPGAWRLLNSVAQDEIIVISIIIEWMSHKDYERRFKY